MLADFRAVPVGLPWVVLLAVLSAARLPRVVPAVRLRRSLLHPQDRDNHHTWLARLAPRPATFSPTPPRAPPRLQQAPKVLLLARRV